MDTRRHPLIYVASVLADESLCRELLKHLRPLYRCQRVKVWCDLDISPGQDRDAEIEAYLAMADLILLLVSPDFLADERVWDLVIQPAMSRHEANQSAVVPVRLRSVSWQGAPFNKLLPIPKGDQAVNECPNRDRTFSDLVEQIYKIMAGSLHAGFDLTERSTATTPPAPSASRAADLATVALSEHALKLADALSKALDKQLDALRESYRHGHQANALQGIRGLCEHEAWDSLEPALRGKLLRTRAIYEIQAETNLETVRSLVARASAIDPEGDDRTVRAVLAYWGGDVDGALTITAEADALSPYNFHLAMLLEAQRTEDARVFLSARSASIQPDFETERLRAILALMSGDIPLARETIGAAIASQPRWQALRETSAIIDFWGSCAPAASAENYLLMPRPFAIELVRLDDEGRERRRRAATTFEALTHESDEPKRRWRYSYWQFLCLVQERETAVQAEQLLSQMLAEHTNLPLLISWALARDLDFDQDAAECALRKVNSAQPGYLDCIGELSGLLESSGRGAEALTLLDTHRERFLTAGAASAWRHWRIRALLALGRQDEAESEAGDETDPRVRRGLLTVCADQHYQRSGDWQSLFELFDKGYRESGSLPMLLYACRLKKQAGEWDYVHKHIETLINHVPTVPVIRLAARAAWECDSPGRCREILEGQEDRFPDKRLPEDLRRLRVGCLRRQGLLSEAIESARADWERLRSWGSLITLLEAQASQGDFAGMAESAGSLLSFASGNAMQLLQVVERVRIRQTDLAKTLWRRAVSLGSEDANFPIAAFMSGMALGFQDELRPLAEAASRLATEGNSQMRFISPEDLPAIMIADREQREETWKRYNQGLIGVHWLGSGRPPLAHFFHTVPDANRHETTNFWHRTPVLARHGARPAEVLGNQYLFSGRLVMDVTALLTAHDLGILEQVEQHFAPIHVSPRLPLYLGCEILGLQPQQPGRLRTIGKVDTLTRVGGIRLVDIPAVDRLPEGDFYQAIGAEWLGWIESLRVDNGALMEFEPLTGSDLKQKPLELPPNLVPFVTSVRAVVGQIRGDALIDEARYKHALSRIESSPASGAERIAPSPGRRLLVLPELAMSLEEAGVLDVIAERYRVEISRRYWEDQYRSELVVRDRDQYAANWLEALLDRIKSGLETGTYTTLPEGPVPKVEQDNWAMAQIQGCGLWDLLHYHGKPTDLVWGDDRWFNGYPGINGSPVVGVFDILQLLRRKALTGEQYYGALTKLRAGDYRHLPMLTDEIVHWLRKAATTRGRVQETKELITLRRYWAIALLDSERLRMPGDENGKSEVGLISQSVVAVQEALTQIWGESTSYAKRQARAQWVMENLYTDLGHVDHLTVRSSPEERRVRIGLNMVGLLVGGMFLDAGSSRRGKDRPSVQQQYMEWITKTVIGPRVVADPECSVAVGEWLCRDLGIVLDQFEKEVPEKKRGARAALHRFVRVLPEPVRGEVHRNGALMARLGLGLCQMVVFGGLEFRAEAFWNAGSQALNVGEGLLKDERGRTYVLRPGGSIAPQAALLLACSKRNERLRIVNPIIGILSPHAVDRRTVLERHPEWRDGTDEGIEVLQQVLDDIESPADRVSRLTEWQARSAATFYASVDGDTRQDGGLNLKTFLVPSVHSLVRYFRLYEAEVNDSLSFTDLWENSTQRMVDDFGIEETLIRAACLPVPLPRRLLERIANMVDSEQIFERLLPLMTSPVSALHVIDLGR